MKFEFPDNCKDARPVSNAERVIGMIAGNGIYPETFINEARKHGVKLVMAAFKGETKEELGNQVDASHQKGLLRVGKTADGMV